MDKTRKRWRTLVVLAVAVITGMTLFLFAAFPALAAQFYFVVTTLQDFNRGSFYHTALSQFGDGAVQLLPIGLGQPWQPGNNNGLPVRAGLAAVYANGYLYAIGGDEQFGLARTEVYYARVYTDILTATGRLSDWQPTTPLPSSVYPEGVWQHAASAMTFSETNKTFIYVFGGTESAPPTTVYDKVLYAEVMADGTLGDWQETASLPLAIYGHESLVLSGTLYVLGGGDAFGESRREVYYTHPDPQTGWITTWNQTTAFLPPLGVGGYIQFAASATGGRIYVYGGLSGTVGATYSIYVHFARPEAGGDITQWTYNLETLPQNCFASEGAAYESGLVLAIAGAWSCGDSGCQPQGDVQVSLADEDDGQTSPWYATVAMDPPRFYHAVAQDDDGFLYSLCGATGAYGPRLNDVDIALPYSGGGGGGRVLETPADLEAAVNDAPIFAPNGRYTSPYIDVRVVDEPWFHATLSSFSWNTTITDAGGMTLTMSYRYYSPSIGVWLPWSEPVASSPGVGVTTTINFPPNTIGDYFQYRAFLYASTPVTSNVAVQTPYLNAVRIGVLSPPDLQAMTLTVICDTCPALIPVDRPVEIEFSARNAGSSLPRNFYAAVFYTTTANYVPWPPAEPPGCAGYDPPTVTCPLVLPQYASNYVEGMPPFTMRTVYTFTTPGEYWLVAQVDYNNTPLNNPPRFDIDEIIETNNITRILITVGVKRIYMPLVVKGAP